MRTTALLSALLVLAAGGLPGEADAKRRCGKHAACRGKVVKAKRTGMPVSWLARGALPGTTPGGGSQAPGGGVPAKPGADPSPPPPPPLPPTDPRYLQVVARDSGETWALQLSRPTLLSGRVQVELNNRFAEDPHDLHVERGAIAFVFPTVDDGAAHTETLALTAGQWKLWCALPGHEAKGMVAHVTVADG